MSRKNRSSQHDPSTLTFVITGGARGIGEATVDRLARQGARIAIGDRDLDLARQVAAKYDDRVIAAALDVTQPESWRSFLAAAASLGPVDVLVNNAGIMPLGSILDEPDSVTQSILDVNLFGVIHGTKAVAPGMVDRGRGHIVNVASAVGRLALAGGATYSASKFAVVGFSEAVRAELEPHGVDVSMVLPTVVKTELSVGVEATRGVKPVTAEQVAEVIEAAVRQPTPELWVPRWSQGLARSSQLMPRGLQVAMAKLLKADSALVGADSAAREAYEARARSRVEN
ncbi:SDR family oxidoreductase [Nocardioides salsibiostraticola]